MGKTFKIRNSKVRKQEKHSNAKKRHYDKPKDRFRFDPQKDYLK